MVFNRIRKVFTEVKAQSDADIAPLREQQGARLARERTRLIGDSATDTAQVISQFDEEINAKLNDPNNPIPEAVLKGMQAHHAAIQQDLHNDLVKRLRDSR